MNKRLLLMRHAEAETAAIGITDFERRLTRRGVSQASGIAKTLKNAGYFPDAILHSAALRATQTAQQIITAFVRHPIVAISEKALYNAQPDKITEAIQIAELPDNIHTLLIIAHNPGISWLALECGWKDPATMYFPPAGIAVFDLNIANWTKFKPQTSKYLSFKTPATNL